MEVNSSLILRDGLRKVGMSKERRADPPQVTAGLLTRQDRGPSRRPTLPESTRIDPMACPQ